MKFSKTVVIQKMESFSCDKKHERNVLRSASYICTYIYKIMEKNKSSDKLFTANEKKVNFYKITC